MGLHRRSFVTLLGSAAAAWPLGAGAQQDGRVRRIGVLMHIPENDLEVKARLAGLRQGLERLGWSDGRNVQINYRFAPDPERMQAAAKELNDVQPDVIFAASPQAIDATVRENRKIPIVFAGITNPVSAGYVASLARPAGSLTGFMLYEPTIAGKWLALLKEIAPRITKVTVLINRERNTFIPDVPAVETLASSLGIDLVISKVGTASDIESTIEAISRETSVGLILPPGPTVLHRDLIIALAARYRVPAVYYARFWVAAGGLMSYGTDYVDQYRQAAAYISRVLRGEKPADLPVQVPTKYETVLNLKTARALGLTRPDLLLVRADDVIE